MKAPFLRRFAAPNYFHRFHQARLDSHAFESWFSGSKVVDSRGKPRKVYHGTSHHFEEFKTEGEGKTEGTGAFFTSDPDNAARYGRVTIPVYLKITHPLEVYCNNKGWDRLSKKTSTSEGNLFDWMGISDSEKEEFASSDDVARHVRESGSFDGVIFYKMKDPGPGGKDFKPQDVFVVFSSSQVRTAEQVEVMPDDLHDRERLGQERLFKRPESDMEAERDGIKHAKVGSPDFGYSQFNDRDKDLKKVKFVSQGLEGDQLGIAAKYEGKDIGHISCSVTVRMCYVYEVQVKNDWRGTGLGQMLYDAAIQEAKRAGLRVFSSDTILSGDADKAWGRLMRRYPTATERLDNPDWDEEDDECTASPFIYRIDLSRVPIKDTHRVVKTAAIFDPIPEPWRNSSYARSTELVPIDELKPYMEYNRMRPSQAREEDPDEYIQELAESIKKEGIREPLILEYSQNTGRALLTEGNHRILAAERAGLTHVPVRGYRRYGPFRGYHKGVIPPEKNFGTDRLGDEYVPQDFKPSVLGIGGSKRGMSHDREAE